VAEHAPDEKRGFYTSFIQTTATLGFFASMAVIAATRSSMTPEAFSAWGWRIPFLISFPLLGVSLYIRLKMHESPLFAKAKSAGQTSKNPLREAFASPLNRKYVLLALFGSTAGMGVVWYTGQFYALTFLQSTLKLSWQMSYTLMSIALALTCPLFVFFGWLSDRIGRNKVMLSGFALAGLTYVPIYLGMSHFANPTGSAVPDPALVNQPMLVLLIALQMVYVCMVYGPTAAFLVELFPTQIRYTSMSVPYHLGTGWFGGFLPLIATALTASTWAKQTLGKGAAFAGLFYPVLVCLLTLVVGGLFIRETRGHRLDTNQHPMQR
jgi:MFS family permease